MMANGASTRASVASPSAVPDQTNATYGPSWGYPAPMPGAWSYQPQLYDPAYGFPWGPTAGFASPMYDSRFGSPGMTYDPRFAESRFGDPRFGIPPGVYDPRLGVPSLDARFGVSIPPPDPRFGFTMLPAFDPRFSQPFPMQDPRMGSWAGPTPMSSPSVVAPQGLGFGYGGPGSRFEMGDMGRWELSRGIEPYGSNRRLTALPTDEEIEVIVFELLDHDPRIPLDADIDVKCEAGRITLAGTVPDKRIKHAAGEVAWWISGVTDVNNSVVVSGRRQAQATRRRRQEPGATGR